MIRDAKWIDGECPETRVSRVARRAVRGRLGAVQYYLPRAATCAEADVEYVHQLRVAARRAKAALDVFAELLPPRRAQRMFKRLQRIRRAAGDARDLDVLIERLRCELCDDTIAALGPVIEYLRTERAAAQRPIIDIYARLGPKRLKRKSARLVKGIRWRGDAAEPSLHGAAQTALCRISRDLFAAAAADLSDPVKLHELRIAGKRLRYGMELLTSAFDDAFRREVYPMVEAMQEHLGAINDHASAAARFSDLRNCEAARSAMRRLDELVRRESTAIDEARAGFFVFWTPERAAELRERLDEYIGQ